MARTSGKFVLRIDPLLHKQLKEKARANGESLNELCGTLIRSGLRGEGPTGGRHGVVVRTARQQFGGAFLGLLLFGSQARGDSHDSSDTDLLIVLDRSVQIRRELYRRWPDPADGREVVHFAHLPEDAVSAGSLWLECALDGIVLHDPEGRVRTALAGLKALIASGRIVRRSTHGQGYWVRV